jgi:phenylacetate-CoA ligase
VISAVYDRLPVFAQNLACDAYGYRVRRQRLGAAFESRRRWLTDSEWWPVERIREYQDANVREVVEHAFAAVPFYRDRMRSAGLTPADIRGVADLPVLPITTKEDVRRHAAEMRADGARNLVHMTTSGTTGKKLDFYVDAEAIAFRWAVWWRHRERFGINPGEWHVNFTGKPVVGGSITSPPFWRRSRPLRQVLVNMQQLTPANIRSLASDLDDMGFEFFTGYPSVIHIYCRLLLEAGIQLRKPPRFVFAGAENVLEHQRRDIVQATGAYVTDQYGFSEGAGNASQCAEGVYHEDFEYGVLECANPEPVEGGVRGRIIATGFASRGFPFLRYEVGDSAVWAGATVRCPCGRASRVIRSIEGRMDDYVITPEGRRVMRFDYVFKNTAWIREAQVVQATLGAITVRLVLSESGLTDLPALRAEIAEWISPSIHVDFEILESIPRERGQKFRAVVSHLSREAREGAASPSAAL